MINKGVNKFGDDTPIGNFLKEADLKVKDIDLSLPKTPGKSLNTLSNTTIAADSPPDKI